MASSFHPPAPLNKDEISFFVVCHLTYKSYNHHLQLRLSTILFVRTCFVHEWRRIKKSGSTLTTIGFVVQAKNGPIWPFLNNDATVSSYYSYFFNHILVYWGASLVWCLVRFLDAYLSTFINLFILIFSVIIYGLEKTVINKKIILKLRRR